LSNKKIKSYLMDEVKGLIWEWDDFQAFTDESPPYNLTPLCPRCWAKLPVTDATHNYQCISCDFKKDYELTHKELIEVVKIEIEKRIKTGEWKLAKSRIKRRRGED
jgi:hypothetical protein